MRLLCPWDLCRSAPPTVTFTFRFMEGGPARFDPPDLGDWPQITLDSTAHAARRVDLDILTPESVAQWRPGETLLLSGHLLTGRDAAHARLVDLLRRR
jgi:fumarate hydratase class I